MASRRSGPGVGKHNQIQLSKWCSGGVRQPQLSSGVLAYEEGWDGEGFEVGRRTGSTSYITTLQTMKRWHDHNTSTGGAPIQSTIGRSSDRILHSMRRQ